MGPENLEKVLEKLATTEKITIAIAREVVVRRDRRVPLVRLPGFSGNIQPPVDVTDFEHLALENDLLAFPRA
jgi:hypothetical protein